MVYDWWMFGQAPTKSPGVNGWRSLTTKNHHQICVLSTHPHLLPKGSNPRVLFTQILVFSEDPTKILWPNWTSLVDCTQHNKAKYGEHENSVNGRKCGSWKSGIGLTYVDLWTFLSFATVPLRPGDWMFHSTSNMNDTSADTKQKPKTPYNLYVGPAGNYILLILYTHKLRTYATYICVIEISMYIFK